MRTKDDLPVGSGGRSGEGKLQVASAVMGLAWVWVQERIGERVAQTIKGGKRQWLGPKSLLRGRERAYRMDDRAPVPDRQIDDRRLACRKLYADHLSFVALDLHVLEPYVRMIWARPIAPWRSVLFGRTTRWNLALLPEGFSRSNFFI